ncbi:MAG: M13 family peptidase, partial [Terriglobales bacterium]
MPVTAPAQSASGLDLDGIDRRVDPCTDFYQYACAGWRKSNPLPADRSRYARFDEIQERNLVTLREILEAASTSSDPTQKKAGDFYASCMDEDAINRKGIKPIASDLKAIASLPSKADLVRYVAASHRRGIPAFFGFGSTQDGKDSSQVIAGFVQGGLGMPNRDYYFEDSDRMKEVRTKYRAFMERMLTLAGDSPAAAQCNAEAIYAMEKALAEASWRPEDLRDPLRTYNPHKVGDLRNLAPDLDMNAYLAGLGAPAMQTVNLNVPAFFTRVSEVLKQRSLDDLKLYLRWQLLITAAPMLSREIDDTNFDFFNRTLAGQKEQRPRWKRCVNRTSFALADAVGTGYAARKYGPEARRRMAEMIDHLKVALGQT